MKVVPVKIYVMKYEEIDGKMKEIKKWYYLKMEAQSENNKMRKN